MPSATTMAQNPAGNCNPPLSVSQAGPLAAAIAPAQKIIASGAVTARENHRPALQLLVVCITLNRIRHPMRIPASFRILSLCVLPAGAAGIGYGWAGASVWDAVYSSAQADRGKAIYAK